MDDGFEDRHASDVQINRRPTAIIAVGWLAIVWAATLAYSAVIFDIGTGRTQVPGGSAARLDWLIFTLKVLATLAISAWVVIAAVGVLRLKRWARYWLFVAVALICVGKVGAIGTFGFSLLPSRTVPDLILAIAFMLFLARPSVGTMFSYRRSLKKITIATSVVIALSASGNIYVYFTSRAFDIPVMTRVAYEPLDDSFYSDGYTRTELPLGYSIALPGRHELLALARSDSTDLTAFLQTSEGHTIIMSNDPLIGARWNFLRRMDSDPYEFSRAVLTERVGVLCLSLKGMLLYPGIAHIDETVIDGLNCLCVWLRPSEVPKTTRWVEYFIFDGHVPIGQVQIFTRGQGPDMPDKALKPIVVSTRRQTGPDGSAEAALAEGLELLGQGRTEEAKLAFAYALCLDWNKPECHFQLARALLKTGWALQAREHAEETLRLRSDFPGAESLLAEIDAARSRETQP
jgi:hypothetical protein